MKRAGGRHRNGPTAVKWAAKIPARWPTTLHLDRSGPSIRRTSGFYPSTSPRGEMPLVPSTGTGRAHNTPFFREKLNIIAIKELKGNNWVGPPARPGDPHSGPTKNKLHGSRLVGLRCMTIPRGSRANHHVTPKKWADVEPHGPRRFSFHRRP